MGIRILTAAGLPPIDMWVKAVYDKKELKVKKVRDCYDAYIGETKTKLGDK